MKKAINTQQSTVNWTGKKIAGTHKGQIQPKDGFLEFEDGKLKGGEVIMDMTTIEVTDLSGESKGQLEGHLNSDDFFGVQDHPTSKLIMSEINQKNGAYSVTGDLTVKGTTHPVTFEITVNDDSAHSKVKIDRTKYGIRYGSGSFFDNLGDNTIRNNFELEVDLKF